MAEELPRIVGWALEGARRVAERGTLTASPISTEIVERWRLSADAVAEFLSDVEAVRRHDDARVARAELYDAFRGWCRDAERKPLGRHKFYGRVEGLGYVQVTTAAGIREYRGIALCP